MSPDYTGSEECVGEAAAIGVGVDVLGESLQRQGARGFEADWTAPLESIAAKAGALTTV